MKKIRVGMLGCGSMGKYVIDAFEAGKVPNAEIAVVCVRTMQSKGVDRVHEAGIPLITDSAQLLDYDLDVVAECASQDSVIANGERLLRAGISFIPMSLGALVDAELLESFKKAAEESGSKLIVPSGGIGALDAFQGAMIPGIESVHMTTRKPPRAWKKIPYVEKMNLDLDNMTEPVLIFDGPARDCVKELPQNINIAAALSLATLGFDKTHITIYADPNMIYNTHTIETKGQTGKITITFENEPVPENPKTAYQACASLVATIKRFSESFRVGT